MNRLIPIGLIAIGAITAITFWHAEQTASATAGGRDAVPITQPSQIGAMAATLSPTRIARTNAALIGNPAGDMQEREVGARHRADRLDAQFARDAAAGTAMLETEQRLQSAIASGGVLLGKAHFSPVDVTPSCRANMCRVEAKFREGEGGEEWSTRLLLEMQGRFASSTVVALPHPDGTSTLVVYGYRPGYVAVE